MARTGWLSFEGRIARLPFILAALALLIAQQLFHGILLGDYWFSPTRFASPLIVPLHEGWKSLFDRSGNIDGIAFGVPILLILLVQWALAAVSFRRAGTVGQSPGLAVLAVVPLIQFAVVVWLALKREQPEPAPESLIAHQTARWQALGAGMLTGAAISVVAVVFFTLVLGTYGASLFAGVPLTIGFVSGYLANRTGDIGYSTYKVAVGALGLAALDLAFFAIEGLVCIVIAFPIGATMAALGATIGRIWVLRRPFSKSTLSCAALLPLLLGLEAWSPPAGVFESVESVDVAASPARVWDSIVHMGPIPAAPAAPFGWGLAYPMSGTIRGEGVGAVREGVFSTGVAYEKVTEWQPGRKLSFVVLSDPPAMRELNPIAEVRAPHTIGYFKTRDARFTIVPLPNGRTRLTLATMHELHIGPIAYWQPIAEWAIHTNKRRVLSHFRTQAERSGSIKREE